MPISPPFRRAFDVATSPLTATNALQVQPGVHVMALDSNGNGQMLGYFQFSEHSDPAAPSANMARLYVRDNGAGKTQLVIRFPTGAIQIIATEP
jgi:hypothetical protein